MGMIGEKRGTRKVVPKEGYLFYDTGMVDHFDESISFDVIPNEQIVTDNGYTAHMFESYNLSLMNYKAIINQFGIELENSPELRLIIPYKGRNYEHEAKRLLACVLELYQLAFVYDN